LRKVSNIRLKVNQELTVGKKMILIKMDQVLWDFQEKEDVNLFLKKTNKAKILLQRAKESTTDL
jgi:hypothetical protein